MKVVTNILTRPTKEQENCQVPKPILANLQGKVGSLDLVPHIVPLHVIRIGQLILCGVPGEPTTMVGRRMQRDIESVIKKSIPDAHVVVAGLSNAYAGYITTPEEYKNQSKPCMSTNCVGYEGASTLFGPLQSVAYIQEFTKLAKTIVENKYVEPGPTPQKHGENILHLSMPHWVDAVPLGLSFGHVKKNARPSYKKGDKVVVKFYGGHPANNLMTEKSFLTVERKNGDKFEVVLTDNDWDTKFKWTRKFLIESIITIEWRIGEVTPVPAGTYVIRHYGYRKHLDSSLQEYSGVSSEFMVV
jgi:neutral ceramidase